MFTAALAASPQFGYRIKHQTLHDRNSFTQGLVVHEGNLVESSGLYGRSFIEMYAPITGQTVITAPLPKAYFAEGVAIEGNTLYLLTWQSEQLLRFTLPHLTPLPALTYQGEGWGLTAMGDHLVMSNGSDQLSVRRPSDFAELYRIDVTKNGKRLKQLNDLTYDGRYLWANLWKRHRIVAIDPGSGKVVGSLNLRKLARENPAQDVDEVLNGLAWDKERQGLWVTGKRWKYLYLLEVSAPASDTIPLLPSNKTL